MIKKLILSLSIIISVGAAGITGTSAMLTDSVTLTDNTFSTGSIDLQISKISTNSTFAETFSGLFTNITLLPGHTETEYFYLRNNASDDDLAIAAQAITGEGTLDPSKVTITLTPVDGSGNKIEGSESKTHTLAQWVANPTQLSTPNIPNNGKQRYKMDVTVSSEVTESNKTFNFSFTSTGTQVVPPTPTP